MSDHHLVMLVANCSRISPSPSSVRLTELRDIRHFNLELMKLYF
mgnify:CR=1 FL=1